MSATLVGGPLDGRRVPRGAPGPLHAFSGRPERGEAPGDHVYVLDRAGRWVHTRLVGRCPGCGAYHDLVGAACTLCGARLRP